MDQTRLDAIRARCDAATPGPWHNGDGSVDRFFAGKNTVATNERVIVERATYNDEFDRQTYADIEFIAASRTDVPDLLDEVARLTAELAAMRTENPILIGEMGEQARRLAAMTAERDEARDKLDWLTEAYDRKMRVHDALNRDYVALRKRAEAAERDISRECETCKFVDNLAQDPPCDNCGGFHDEFDGTRGWEWRGPVDGTKEEKI